MKITDDRKLFSVPIGAEAAAGNIATIPQTQATAGDGTASVALGFPPETFIARAAGGEPPRGQDMNGLLNLLSGAVQVLQAGYLGPFDANFAQGIGGYPAGAIVAGVLPGAFWVSTADANVSIPGADGAAWQSLFNGYATQAWANGRFLQLDDTGAQDVTGPVAFSGATTVPSVTAFTGADALNAVTADGRYIGSVPASGQTRITGLVENADGRAVFSDGTKSTVLANYTDIPVSFTSARQVIQENIFYSVPHNLGRTPVAFGIRLVCVTAELGYVAGQVAQFCTNDNQNGWRNPVVTLLDGNLVYASGDDACAVTKLTSTSQLVDIYAITNANWNFQFWAM